MIHRCIHCRRLLVGSHPIYGEHVVQYPRSRRFAHLRCIAVLSFEIVDAFLLTYRPSTRRAA